MYSYLQYLYSHTIAYLDSAASDNYENNKTPLINIHKINQALPVHLTNRNTIQLIHKGIFDSLPAISIENKTCQICPE